jgi:hypothetical protein
MIPEVAYLLPAVPGKPIGHDQPHGDGV